MLIMYIDGKLFATQALSQTQKNVSEPQTGIEPATFWSPVKRGSNHWATSTTEMAERRLPCVLISDVLYIRTANTAVSINLYIYYLLTERDICISEISDRRF